MNYILQLHREDLLTTKSMTMRIAFTFAFLVQCSCQLFSQSSADTAFLVSSAASAKNFYSKFILGNAHLYNGGEHKAYQSLEEEHPYFVTDDFDTGSIVYDNESYDDVGMMYDIRNDKVVIEQYSNSNKLELVSGKISEFTLHGHTFVALKPDTAAGQIQEGFYDQLYKGNTRVYARRIKQFQERIEANVLHRSFSEVNRYFIFKGGKYFQVNSKSSVLEVFADKKKMLKQYLSKSGIRFKQDKEKALVKMAEYYDTLKDQ